MLNTTQTTIRELTPQFNLPVTTPDGPGYLVAQDGDGLLLISVIQKPDRTHARCRQAWYKPEDVVERRV